MFTHKQSPEVARPLWADVIEFKLHNKSTNTHYLLLDSPNSPVTPWLALFAAKYPHIEGVFQYAKPGNAVFGYGTFSDGELDMHPHTEITNMGDYRNLEARGLEETED